MKKLVLLIAMLQIINLSATEPIEKTVLESIYATDDSVFFSKKIKNFEEFHVQIESGIINLATFAMFKGSKNIFAYMINNSSDNFRKYIYFEVIANDNLEYFKLFNLNFNEFYNLPYNVLFNVQYDGYPVHTAIKNRSINILTEYKSSILIQDNVLDSLLVYSNDDRINNIFNKNKIIRNVDTLKNSINLTPLMWAIIENDVEKVKLLVESGANVNEKNYDNLDNFIISNLMLATIFNNYEIVKYLVDNNADISDVTYEEVFIDFNNPIYTYIMSPVSEYDIQRFDLDNVNIPANINLLNIAYKFNTSRDIINLITDTLN